MKENDTSNYRGGENAAARQFNRTETWPNEEMISSTVRLSLCTKMKAAGQLMVSVFSW